MESSTTLIATCILVGLANVSVEVAFNYQRLGFDTVNTND